MRYKPPVKRGSGSDGNASEIAAGRADGDGLAPDALTRASMLAVNKLIPGGRGLAPVLVKRASTVEQPNSAQT